MTAPSQSRPDRHMFTRFPRTLRALVLMVSLMWLIPLHGVHSALATPTSHLTAASSLQRVTLNVTEVDRFFGKQANAPWHLAPGTSGSGLATAVEQRQGRVRGSGRTFVRSHAGSPGRDYVESAVGQFTTAAKAHALLLGLASKATAPVTSIQGLGNEALLVQAGPSYFVLFRRGVYGGLVGAASLKSVDARGAVSYAKIDVHHLQAAAQWMDARLMGGK